MLSPVPDSVVSTLRSKIDTLCNTPDKPGIPGAVFVAVDRNGERFAYASGKRGVASNEPMTLDSVFSILSCTKLVTAVACMQLVEQGVLRLDDVDQAESLAPELREVKVLQEDGQLVEKTSRITLRMLLSHTCKAANLFFLPTGGDSNYQHAAGFAYSFFHKGVRDHGYPAGYDEFSGHISGITQSLVHQPGEAWRYGVF